MCTLCVLVLHNVILLLRLSGAASLERAVRQMSVAAPVHEEDSAPQLAKRVEALETYLVTLTERGAVVFMTAEAT